MPGDLPDWTTRVQARAQAVAPQQAILATEAGASVTVLAAQANVIYVVTQVILTPAANVGDEFALRDWVWAEVRDPAATVIVAQLAVSPGAPVAAVDVPAGAGVFPVNTAVDAAARTRPGSGNQYVLAQVTYYELEG